MVKELKRKFGRIDKAYCFELHAIFDAYQGLERGIDARDYHLYCPTPGCGWKLSGGLKHAISKHGYEIAWYVGEDFPAGCQRSHAPDCKYGTEKRTSNGDGTGQSTPPKIPDRPAGIFIPSEIVDPFSGPQNCWLGQGPDPLTLENLIRAATGKPVGGTLEEVVDAERFLAKKYSDFKERKKGNPDEQPPLDGKPNQPLRISARASNYRDGIVDLYGKELDFRDPGFWKQNIVHCNCFIKKESDHGYSLYPYGNKFSIYLDATDLEGSGIKAYLEPMLNGLIAISNKSRVKCFLWDLEPLVRQDGSKPTFQVADRGSFMRMALRAMPPMKE